MDVLADSRPGCSLTHSFPRNKTATFRRRNQRVVRRSNGQGRVLSIRPYQLSRPTSFLHHLFISDVIWPESLCPPAPSGFCQPRGGLAGIEIRSCDPAAGRTHSGAGHGPVTRFHFLWSLRSEEHTSELQSLT